jgi:hypothetical protein
MGRLQSMELFQMILHFTYKKLGKADDLKKFISG